MTQALQADIHYYDRTDYERQQAAAAERERHGSRITSWLRGESLEQYQKRLQAAGHTITATKIYFEKERVRKETARRLHHQADVAFGKLQNAMPAPVRSLMRKSGEGHTLSNMPHLGYVEIFHMNAVYPDGSRSRLRFISSNFEAAAVPGQDGLHFKSIPVQKDGVINRDAFFIYGRKIGTDGMAGELDPYFSKNGAAYRPKDLKAVAEALFRVGKMTVIAQKQFPGGTTTPPRPDSAGRPSVGSRSAPANVRPASFDPTEFVIPLEDDNQPTSFAP